MIPIAVKSISDPSKIRVQLLASGQDVHAPLNAVAGAAIHGATLKATPADTDEFGYYDTTAGSPAKATWANLKSAMWSGSTWTPQLAFGGASTGITYSLNTAVVRQIGHSNTNAATLVGATERASLTVGTAQFKVGFDNRMNAETGRAISASWSGTAARGFQGRSFAQP